MSSLFKPKPGKSTQETTTTKSLPDWLQNAYQGLISQSQSAAGMGMTPEEQAAASYLSGNIGNYQGAFDQGIGSTQSILDKVMAGGPSTADIQAGMNPYLDMILNRQRQEADKSYYSGLAQLQDQEASAGAFGGSRSAVAQETLRNNYADNLAKLQEQGLYNAFETSRNQYNQNLNTGLGASVNLANLGGAAQQGVMNTATGLAQAGAMPRNIAQGNSSFLNSILAPAAQTMVGTNQNSTTTTQAPQGSMFSQLLGAGLGIAGMAGGFGGLGGLFGSTLGSATMMPTIMNAAGGLSSTLSNGEVINWNSPVKAASGGMIPDKAKFNAGGAVKEMPQWLRDDPSLTPLEKEMMWDKEVEMERFYEKHRPAADREYNLENIPVRAPEVAEEPYVEPDFNTLVPFDEGTHLLLEYPKPERRVSPRESSRPVPISEKPLPWTGPKGNLFNKPQAPDLSEAQLAAILERNPSLANKMAEIDNMSEEAFRQLFAPLTEQQMEAKWGPVVKKAPVSSFDGGSVVIDPSRMSAEEEEMYWRNRMHTRPTLSTILNMRPSAAMPKNTLNAYLAGSGPRAPKSSGDVYLAGNTPEAKPYNPLQAALDGEGPVGRNRLENEDIMKALGKGWEASVEGATNLDRALGRINTAVDDLRDPAKQSGKSRLQRLVDPAISWVGEVGLAPVNLGRAIPDKVASGINWLMEDPEVSEAERAMADLAARAQMTTEERRIQDLIDAGVTPENAPAAMQRLAPTEQVGEVVSRGKSVPVETAKKPSMSEVEKAVKAQEAKPEEQQGMNIPLIMAGIALMTSKGDPFTSMGEGLAAYLSGKQQIENNKKEAAKQAKAEALAERAMQVDEGKLGVMRDQIDVDLRRLAIEAKKANKENQYTKSQLIDDYSNLFKTIVDNEVLAAQEKGGVADMGALLSRAGDRTMERLYHAQGLTPPAQYVKLTPTQQMAADMKSKPVR